MIDGIVCMFFIVLIYLIGLSIFIMVITNAIDDVIGLVERIKEYKKIKKYIRENYSYENYGRKEKMCMV